MYVIVHYSNSRNKPCWDWSEHFNDEHHW